MGIDKFHKCIKENYGGAFKNEWLKFYDHVYIDINFALHYCSYGARCEDEICKRLFKLLDGIIQELVPMKTVTLGCDGSAPLSKLVLQRKRRQCISRNLKCEESTSSLMFTPGTLFMSDLKVKINEYIKDIEKIYCIDATYLDINVDEAELKLKKQVSDNLNNILYKNDSHVYVSNDADVVIMLTTLDDYSNVFIYSKSNQQSEIISIGKLIDIHTSKVGSSLNSGLDFTAIGIMLGNDYLPKISYTDFNKLWDSYAKIIKHDPKGLIINKSTLEISQTFLTQLLAGVVSVTKPQFIKKLLFDNAYHPLYKNYLDGYTWCLDTYVKGVCTRYNYMYNFQESPHPLGLIFNLQI